MAPFALMIVDLQQEAVSGDAELERVVRDVVRHVEQRRDEYAVVVASRFRNEPGSTYARLVDAGLRTDDEVALVPAIERVADFVVESPTYSSLTPRVQQTLVDASVREVHVVGVDTDQCVLATVFALFDAGYEPRVFDDLVASASGETCHRAGLVALRRAIGDDRVHPA